MRWFPIVICFLYLLNFTNLWRRVWRTSPQIEPLQVIRCKPGLQLGTRFLTLASTGLFDMSKCVMSGTYFNPKMRKLWTCNETLCATHFPDEYPFTLYASTPEARLVQDVSCISNVTHYLKIIITWWQGSRWCGSHSCCIYEYLPEQNWAKFRTEQLDFFDS